MSEQQKERDYGLFLAGLGPAKLAAQACRHLEFAGFLAVQRLEDTGRFYAELRVVCRDCLEPFRFQGLEPGLLHERPSCSIDGLEAFLPIEPELQKRLFGGARYEVPPKPETRQ